jgi:Protein of unknown function (DUF2950)
MSHLLGLNRLVARIAVCSALMVMIVTVVSCERKPGNTTVGTTGQGVETADKAVGTTGKETQRTFASPAEAGAAFHEAAKSGDQTAFLAIFGPDSTEVLFSGDPVKDRNALTQFVSAYETMNRWRPINGGGEMLYVGPESFPFPVPLLQTESGRWYFDSAGGADEILARRIGRNELVAMAAIGALSKAEQQYYNTSHAGGGVKQYAQKFVSDEGQQNGLYWPSSDTRTQSPLGQLGDFAKGAGYTNSGNNPQPFNGYYFRILTKQGDTAKGGAKDYIVNGKMTDGFAILAYPEKYQDSGIMSFLVGTDGTVYEKDLGPMTTDTAVAMTEYSPSGWKAANDQGSRE